MWSNVVEACNCRIQVYEGGCAVEIRSAGQLVFQRRCANLNQAFEQAETLGLTYNSHSPTAAAARQLRQRAA
jgi:O-acetyl-ADP-ribose deacetylase (regulator of RNase III)